MTDNWPQICWGRFLVESTVGTGLPFHFWQTDTKKYTHTHKNAHWNKAQVEKEGKIYSHMKATIFLSRLFLFLFLMTFFSNTDVNKTLCCQGCFFSQSVERWMKIRINRNRRISIAYVVEKSSTSRSVLSCVLVSSYSWRKSIDKRLLYRIDFCLSWKCHALFFLILSLISD